MPLNAICSSRCERPRSRGRSCREPAATQTPSDTVSRCGIRSVTMRRPDGRRRDFDAHDAAPARRGAALQTPAMKSRLRADRWAARRNIRAGFRDRRDARAAADAARSRRDGRGEFRRMRGAEYDCRNVRMRGQSRACGANADCGMRIDQISAFRARHARSLLTLFRFHRPVRHRIRREWPRSGLRRNRKADRIAATNSSVRRRPMPSRP